jgi:hypothetical protein
MFAGSLASFGFKFNRIHIFYDSFSALYPKDITTFVLFITNQNSTQITRIRLIFADFLLKFICANLRTSASHLHFAQAQVSAG